MVKKKTRYTKRFTIDVHRLTAITTNKEAGWYLGLDDEAIYRIDKQVLEEKFKEKLEPTPTAINISIDEVAYKKYHNYLTNVIDTDRKLIIWNADGRKKEILDEYYKAIGQNNCEAIESAALDGAQSYISSTKKYAVNALIVYDKFHVVQKLNKTIDAVRRHELGQAKLDENEELIELTKGRQRFILLKKKENLTKRQQTNLDRLCEINENIYKAMLLKESFLHMYSYVKEEKAKEYLNNWIKEAKKSEIEAFEELAEKFEIKKDFLLNWFKKKISSAISEGFNNKIKRLKRMAYGFRDVEYFRLKIHQHCGLLNPKLDT